MSPAWRRTLRWGGIAAYAWIAGSAGYGALVPPAAVIDCTPAQGCAVHEDPTDLAIIAGAGAPWAATVVVVALRRRPSSGARGTRVRALDATEAHRRTST
ncbi:hypothetical protein [Cellulomonas hominis]|uniref:hypothetical protein n=1 Tax=Cellulomonas hominis TaxID=156981 RepID=UPI001B9A9EE6|nr:hypothetical protein [Cellulomonas hominis]VTR75402.1 hypothetical protein CHMI_00146 [Cellulomonas hominis]